MLTLCSGWEIAAAFGAALGSFIRDYQSLIAGLLAIIAAIIAAKPVWRQLDRMSIQTNAILREFLTDRIQITVRRRKWLAERLEPFTNAVLMRLYEMQESEVANVNIHWAFDKDHTASRLLDEMRRYRDDRHHSVAIRSQLDAVIEKLQILRDTFEKIHRTHSIDQVSEDYAISDEDWAAMQADGAKAETDLPRLALEFSEAVKILDVAFSRELTVLRERLGKTDDQLLHSPL